MSPALDIQAVLLKGEVPVAGAKEQAASEYNPRGQHRASATCTLFKEPRREDTELGDKG